MLSLSIPAGFAQLGSEPIPSLENFVEAGGLPIAQTQEFSYPDHGNECDRIASFLSPGRFGVPPT